jgi:hypothetical protein
MHIAYQAILLCYGDGNLLVWCGEVIILRIGAASSSAQTFHEARSAAGQL